MGENEIQLRFDKIDIDMFSGSRSIKSSTIAINDIEVQGNLTKNQREHQIKNLDNLFLRIRKSKTCVYIYERKHL